MDLASLAAFIQGIIGAGEAVIPMFVHNPRSQKIETVVFTDVNSVASIVAQVVKAQAAPAAAPAAAKPAA
jgi:hypothetical protein